MDISIVHAWRIWNRNLTLYKRTWKLTFLPQFFQPVFYLVAMGLVLGFYIGEEVGGFPYIEYIGPGLAASAAMNGAAFELTFNVFVKRKFARLYDAVMAAPPEPQDIAFGEILWATTRAVIFGLIFLAVMGALGHVRIWSALMAPVAFALTGLSIGMLAMIFTGLIDDMDMFSYFFNLFLIPVFLFSGIFFPIDVLPGPAAAIAWFTPLLHGAEMTRAATLTGEWGGIVYHGVWMLVFTIVLMPLAVHLFRRRLVV